MKTWRGRMRGIVVVCFVIAVAMVAGAVIKERLVLSEHSRRAADSLLALVDEDLKALEKDKIALQREQISLEMAGLLSQKEMIPFWAMAKKYSVAGLLSALCFAIIMIGLSIWRKASIHDIELYGNKLKLKSKDLDKVAGIANGIKVVEEMRAQGIAQERQAELLLKLASSVSRRIDPGLALPEHVQPSLMAARHIPSFSELLNSGTIAAGKPLVFGVAEDGSIRSGTWLDLFSNATAGQSGSGKTSTLRSIIGQSVLQGVQFLIHDEHFPHPESLISSLGEIAGLPNIKHSGDMSIEQMMHLVDEKITRRMCLEEPDNVPLVLVIDEVLEAIDKYPGLSRLIKRIGIAGRKVHVYGMFSAQSWLASDVGGTTVRDNLTSRIVHRMEKHQARTLLKDKDLAAMCPSFEDGEILFAPVNGKKERLYVPYCQASDMHTIYKMVSGGAPVMLNSHNMPVSLAQKQKNVETHPKREETQETPNLSVEELRQTLRDAIETETETYYGLGERSGVNRGQIKKFHDNNDGNGKPFSGSQGLRKKLEKALEMPKKREETPVINLWSRKDEK